MRVGDAATAGVVLTNIDARQHTVNVGITAQVVKVKGESKKSVTLKPGDTAEVAFDLAAPAEGTAKLAFSVDSDILRERLEDSLSVADPHLTESFTIVGKTTDMAKEGLVVPSSFLGVPEEGLYLITGFHHRQCARRGGPVPRRLSVRLPGAGDEQALRPRPLSRCWPAAGLLTSRPC